MYLVINLGLKSIRGIIFSEEGSQLYSKSFPVHTTLFNDKVEQDSDEWNELLNGILSDIKENTDLSNSIRYVTVTTSSSCVLGVDDRNKPLTKVLMVSDKRSFAEVQHIKESDLYKTLSKDSNLPCATSSLIPKALWFKKNQSPTFDKVSYWIGAGEYLNHFFTGEFFTDPLNASKAFHNGSMYCEELIKSFGIPTSSLPEVRPTGSVIKLKPGLIDQFQFHPDCEFVLTTYDAICAVLGSSNGKPMNACDVSGTVTSVRLLNDKAVNSGSSVLLCQQIDLINKYLIGASNNLGGGIIEWHKQAFFKKGGSSVYFKMENAAQNSKVGANGMIFLPYLLGERAPMIAPNASGTFFGIKRNSTIKEFTRAVFESTAYVTRDLIELIEKSGSIEVDSITVSGGLARFDLINQIKADVSNKPVYVVDNFESTSIGAFILMAIAKGRFASIEEALKSVVKIRKIINPSEHNHAIYDEYFQLYKKLNSNLESIYATHKDLQDKQSIHENETVRNL